MQKKSIQKQLHKNFKYQHTMNMTRLMAFHIALLPMGKVWTLLFSHQLWVNSGSDWAFLGFVRQPIQKKENTEFQLVETPLKIDLMLHLPRAYGLVNTYKENDSLVSSHRITLEDILDIDQSSFFIGLLTVLQFTGGNIQPWRYIIRN